MKDLILGRLLKFVERYVPLPEAWCATLGGQGVEARLWQEAGVLPERGILIERSTKLSRPLIANLPYEYYPRLESFAEWWGWNRPTQHLDFLHLDLCGTLEPLLDIVRSMLPLVSASRGRCVAVTVTEKRRNRSLEAYELIRARMSTTLGETALDQVEQRLRTEHELLENMTNTDLADPEKGMKREVGLLWCLAQLLVAPDGSAQLPDCIERYVYWSNYGRRTCRMRTYVLHLAPPVPGPVAAQTLTALWVESPLSVGHDGTIQPIIQTALAPPPKRPRGRPKGSVTRRIALGEPAGARVNGAEDPVLAAQPALLRAEAEGPDELQNALGTVASSLGFRGRSDRTRHTLSALRAKMFGRFRPTFVRAAVALRGEAALAELAALYSRLKGQPVTIEELRAEADVVPRLCEEREVGVAPRLCEERSDEAI